MYLHTRYNEKIALDGLCSHFATNRTTLNRLFTESCGMSVIAYLNHIRMEIAVSLLQNTELPVSEVADRVGIEDISYFGRAFKKKTGFSPSAFRKAIPSPYVVAH
jgi:AraC family L-rhamnose operon regulatory protein RhaS